MPYETRCKTRRTTAKARATKSRRNFSQGTIPIQPIGPQTDVLVRFVSFGCIRDCLVALRNSVVNGPNYWKSLCHEVELEFFATNAPDPPHMTPNSCFGAFHTIWVHLGPLQCLKTRGKTGRTCKSSCHEVSSEFFATNPLDPLHWSLNSCFGVFRTIWVFLRPFHCLTKLGAKRSELVQKSMP